MMNGGALIADNEPLFVVDNMEKILAVLQIDPDTGFDGYEVHTDKQVIVVKIDNRIDCCEHPGCFIVNDDVRDFIGANLLDVYVTDIETNSYAIPIVRQMEGEIIEEPENIMFVNLVTDRGNLQFIAYNSHNGYYGHDAVLISNQLTFSEVL